MYFNESSNTNIDNKIEKNNTTKLRNIIIIIFIMLFVIFLIFFLMNKFKKIYYLDINGSSNIIVYKDSDYVDEGYKAYDNKNNVYEDVEVVNNVNTSIIGDYTVIYKFQDIEKVRNVTVIDNNRVTYFYLKGDSVIYLKLGEEYKEEGWVVIDSLEKGLDSNVKVDGTVDSNKIGTYIINYSFINSDGVSFNKKRIVIVNEGIISLSIDNDEYTNFDININVNIVDNYFDYVVLPDGSMSKERKFVYKVSENGTYKFTSYGTDGNISSKEIIINNIDRDSPSGTCTGYYKNGKSYITIDSKDNIGIQYYLFNNVKYTSRNITVDDEYSFVNIQIYDEANNFTNISCSLVDKNTYYSSSSSSSSKSSSSSSIKINDKLSLNQFTADTGNKYSYWLYVPRNSSNLPMIVFLHGSGESGNDYKNNSKEAITWGIGKDIYNGANFNAIVLMPQTTSNWSNDILVDIKSMIDYVANKYSVNKNKISLAGFSMGCYALYRIVDKIPNYFSALVPIECKIDTSHVSKFKKYPIWSFASQSETNESLNAFANAINRAGGNAKHTYKGNSHTYLVGNKMSIFTDESLDLVNWMTSQNKS